MNNKYSKSLLIVMIILLALGGWMLFSKVSFWGLVPFIAGFSIMQGFKGPVSKPNRKIWMLTFFGKQTTTIVESFSLILDWLPFDVIGYNEIDMKKVNKDFELKKPILCSDKAYVICTISVSMMPDDKDDPLETLNGKTRGEKLRDFLNIGKMDGIIEQLDQLIPAGVQRFAIAKRKTSEEMEVSNEEIAKDLLDRLTGKQTPDTDISDELDDTRGFGIRFTKFQPVIQPPPKVVEARNDRMVELAQREAEMEDIMTTDKLTKERMKTDTKLSAKEARDQVFDEKALKAGAYKKVVNVGGLNVTNT